MSRCAVRSIAGRGLLLALLAICLLGLVAPRAQSAPTPPGEQAILADFGSCLAGGATGSIVQIGRAHV